MAMKLRLRELRQARGLTIDQLSDMSGLSRGFLSLLENDKRQPSAAALQSLADAFRVKLTDMIEDGASAEAAELLDLLPSLSPEDRQRILWMARALAEKPPA